MTPSTFQFTIFYGNFSAGGHKVTVNFKHDFTVIFDNVTSVEIQSEFCEVWKNAFEIAFSMFSSPPADFEDDDCSDNTIKIAKTNGDLNLIFTSVEVS